MQLCENVCNIVVSILTTKNVDVDEINFTMDGLVIKTNGKCYGSDHIKWRVHRSFSATNSNNTAFSSNKFNIPYVWHFRRPLKVASTKNDHTHIGSSRYMFFSQTIICCMLICW